MNQRKILRPSPDRGSFARPEIADLIEETLRDPAQKVLVVSGERCSGKTTLLRHLQQGLPSPSFLPVYFDLLGWCNFSLAAARSDLIATVALTAGLPPAHPSSSSSPDDFRARLLPELYQRIGEDCRPVLLLDQLDLLDEEQGEGRLELISYLHELIREDERLALVFTVGKPVKEMSPEIRALLLGAQEFSLSLLSESAARSQLLAPWSRRPVRIKEAALGQLLRLCGGHPYFLQLARQVLFDASRDQLTMPEIRVEEVSEKEGALLSAATTGCAWIWDGLSLAERAVLFRLGQNHHPVLSDNAEEEMAVSSLLRRQVLVRRDGQLSYSVEILRRYVLSLKTELRQVRKVGAPPPAPISLPDELCQIARALRSQGDEVNALPILAHALQVAPKHLRVRVLLAEIHLSRKNPQEALATLNPVADGDTEKESPALCRVLYATLLQMGLAAQEASKEDEALSHYERALGLPCDTEEAAARHAAIWMRRADQALLDGDGDYDLAMTCYEKAGAADKAKAVFALRRRRLLERAATEAQQAMWQENFAQAADRFTWLLSEDPDEMRWREGAARCRIELEIRRHYEDGVEALKEGALERAMAALGRVTAARPAFKDAADLLASAVRRFEQKNGTWMLRPTPPNGESVLSKEVVAPTPETPPSSLSRSRRLGTATGLFLGAPVWLVLGVAIASLLGGGYSGTQRQTNAPLPQKDPVPAVAAADPIGDHAELEGARAAARAFLLADLAMQEHRWEQAQEKLDQVLALSEQALSPTVREVAKAKRAEATKEKESQGLYLTLRDLVTQGSPPAEVVRRYQMIPHGSVYRVLGQPEYTAALEAVAKDQLRRAEIARVAGRCWEFRYFVSQVLALSPEHEPASTLGKRRCQEAPLPPQLARTTEPPPMAPTPASPLNEPTP